MDGRGRYGEEDIYVIPLRGASIECLEQVGFYFLSRAVWD